MLNVAIVEDDDAAAAKLQACLDQYTGTDGVRFNATRFVEATSFLEGYKPSYDLVFMDIEMPNMNGMEAARRLREVDEQVVLIFVTNMAQFAAKGYEVDALDYIVKPFSYPDFERKLKRAVRLCEHESDAIVVSQQGGTVRLLLREIEYLEVRGHNLILHAESGVVHGSGTLAEAQERLGDKGFLRCAKAFLVNARHIREVRGSTLLMADGTELPIGRAFRKTFMEGLTRAMGVGNVL